MGGKGQAKLLIAIVAIVAAAVWIYVQFVVVPTRPEGTVADFKVEAKLLPGAAGEKLIKVQIKVKNTSEKNYKSASGQLMVWKDNKIVHAQEVGLTGLPAGEEITSEIVLTNVRNAEQVRANDKIRCLIDKCNLE